LCVEVIMVVLGDDATTPSIIAGAACQVGGTLLGGEIARGMILSPELGMGKRHLDRPRAKGGGELSPLRQTAIFFGELE